MSGLGSRVMGRVGVELNVRSSEYREYENGIADILTFLVPDVVSVRRNVRLPTRLGNGHRQIDVLVEGRMFGLARGRMIVDCKNWKTKVDRADVDRLIGTIGDVECNVGMIVSSAGATEGAAERAKSASVPLLAISMEDLSRWRPRGTYETEYEVQGGDLGRAMTLIRNQGYRAILRIVDDEEFDVLTTLRNHGKGSPSIESQLAQREVTEKYLSACTVQFRHCSSAITGVGGTPMHRWLNVNYGGWEFKVIAADEEELEFQLGQFGILRSQVEIDFPVGWPFPDPFGV
jgi:hypothetical protein